MLWNTYLYEYILFTNKVNESIVLGGKWKDIIMLISAWGACYKRSRNKLSNGLKSMSWSCNYVNLEVYYLFIFSKLVLCLTISNYEEFSF